MPLQDKPAGNSPFEIVTPGKSKKVGKTGIIVGVSIVVFLILSVVAGVLLVRQNQQVAEKAACSQQCGVGPADLVDCSGADTDGAVSQCTFVRIESCGGQQYCCPSAGGSWTTDMTACAASPTPTATAVATATPTATPTPTATSSGSANTCNGTCGSNSNCQNGLYCYSGFCRNPLCASDSACGCSSATATPTPTATAKATSAGAQTTPLPIPVTGTNWPTVFGIGAGAAAIIVSLLLAL